MEETLQWAYLKSKQSLQDEYDATATRLLDQIAKVMRYESESSVPASTSAAVVVATQITTAKSTVESHTALPRVRLHILCGEQNVGESIMLSPSFDKPCKVGRSKGKAFRQGGLSLSKDLEVSTTHGQFELRNDLDSNNQPYIYFTDLESTNGTTLVSPPEGGIENVTWTLTEDRQVCMLDVQGKLSTVPEEMLEPYEPKKLFDGCILHIGATLLAVQLVDV